MLLLISSLFLSNQKKNILPNQLIPVYNNYYLYYTSCILIYIMASIMLTAFSLASCFPKFDNTSSEIIILTWCLRFLLFFFFFIVHLFFAPSTVLFGFMNFSLKCSLTEFLSRSPVLISSSVHQTSCLCHKILQYFILYISILPLNPIEHPDDAKYVGHCVVSGV